MESKLWIALRGLVLIGLALGAAMFSRMSEEQSAAAVSLIGVQSVFEATTPATGPKSPSAAVVWRGSMDAGAAASQYSQWAFYCGLGCAALGGVELTVRLRSGRALPK